MGRQDTLFLCTIHNHFFEVAFPATIDNVLLSLRADKTNAVETGESRILRQRALPAGAVTPDACVHLSTKRYSGPVSLPPERRITPEFAMGHLAPGRLEWP